MLSPYCFANNDPIRNIDVYGEGPGDRVKKAESFLGTKYSQKASLNQGTELRTGSSEAALEYIDCSELVCRVLFSDQTTPVIRQWSTAELETKLADKSNFHHSNDDPREGDVFLWRSDGKGHTGIVKSYDPETQQVTIVHAKGTSYGTVEETLDLSYFTGHTGWKGFYRPIAEHEGSIEYIINSYSESLDFWKGQKEFWEKRGNTQKAANAQEWIDVTQSDFDHYIETGEQLFTLPASEQAEIEEN